MHPLIDSDELAGRLDEVRLCDIRWSLTDRNHGRATYEAGHIPTAVFVDLDADLSAPPGPGRHPLPSPEAFAATLGELGISPEDEVVVYDDVNGGVAARMWWMLRSIGHEESRLFDGGYQSWVSRGLPVEESNVNPEPASYPTPVGFTGVVTHDQLGGRVLIDARAPERYVGDVEPVDPRAGHIPGAISLPTSGNLAPDGTFLDATVLERRYADVGDNPVVSCGSGVTSCHDALAIVLAGGDMPDVYVGSFSEWSRLDLPVATGERP